MADDDPQLPPGDSRPLTEGEKRLARSVFGNAINYDEVRVVHGKEGLGWDVADALGSMFGAQNTRTRPQVVGNSIYFPRGDYKDDFSTQGGDRTFIHEMTHIWQVQNHMAETALRTAGDVVANGLNYDQTYSYKLERGKDLGDYNLEQQADIVADFYTWRRDKDLPSTGESLSDDPTGTRYVAAINKFLQDTPADSPFRKWGLHGAAVDIGQDGIARLNPDKYKALIERQAQAAEEERQVDATRLGVMDNFLRNPGYLNPVPAGVARDIFDTTVNAVPAALAAIKKFTIG